MCTYNIVFHKGRNCIYRIIVCRITFLVAILFCITFVVICVRFSYFYFFMCSRTLFRAAHMGFDTVQKVVVTLRLRIGTIEHSMSHEMFVARYILSCWKAFMNNLARCIIQRQQKSRVLASDFDVDFVISPSYTIHEKCINEKMNSTKIYHIYSKK